MKNIKLELFNYRKKLSIDKEEIANIIEQHIKACDTQSEKVIIKSLNESLKPYMFDKSVCELLESLNNDMNENEILYELKNLYHVLNSKNQGSVYSHPINVILKLINMDDDRDRLYRIYNDLSIYDWIPEVKLFLMNVTKSSEKKSNILSGGKSEHVYTIVEPVDDGYITYIKNNWFLINDSEINKIVLADYIKNEDLLKSLNTIQYALGYCTINKDRIEFRLSDKITIGLSVNKKGVIYINDDEMDSETTLENIFESPLIPIINKNFYPIILEVYKNIDKFVDLDIARKITNVSKPHIEIYVFNYKNNNYVYRCDDRYGYSLFKYDSAIELVEDIKREMACDITYFFADKLDKEIVIRKKLDDKEKEITKIIECLDVNIGKLENSIKLLGETEVLSTALNNLMNRRKKLEKDLMAIKELKYKDKHID